MFNQNKTNKKGQKKSIFVYYVLVRSLFTIFFCQYYVNMLMNTYTNIKHNHVFLLVVCKLWLGLNKLVANCRHLLALTISLENLFIFLFFFFLRFPFFNIVWMVFSRFRRDKFISQHIFQHVANNCNNFAP